MQCLMCGLCLKGSATTARKIFAPVEAEAVQGLSQAGLAPLAGLQENVWPVVSVSHQVGLLTRQ